MATRVQVILEETDKQRFQRQAQREGISLSAWLREARSGAIEDREAELATANA